MNARDLAGWDEMINRATMANGKIIPEKQALRSVMVYWPKKPAIDPLLNLRFPRRETLPVAGPKQWVEGVQEALWILESKAPERFREVLLYLPKAVFDPTLEDETRLMKTTADGRFFVYRFTPESILRDLILSTGYRIVWQLFPHDYLKIRVKTYNGDNRMELANHWADRVHEEIAESDAPIRHTRGTIAGYEQPQPEAPPEPPPPPPPAIEEYTIDGFRYAGPPKFCAGVKRVLDELRDLVPIRYREVVGQLPQAVFDGSLRGRNGALADGRFGYTAEEAGYEWFRSTMLHETGHNIHGKGAGDWSEGPAEAYVATVIGEIEEEWADRRTYQDWAYGVRLGHFSGYEAIDITIDGESRRQGTYIIGKNGTGKSTLLEHMILQDAARDCGVVVLDPHGQLIDRVLRRLPEEMLARTTVLDFSRPELTPGLNLYWCEDPADPRSVAAAANRSFEVFRKIWEDKGWGPRMADLLLVLGHTLAAAQGTLLDVLPLLTDEDYRERILARVTNPQILHYWRREYSESIIAPVTNKVRAFTLDPTLSLALGRRWTYQWSFKRPKITLVKLPMDPLGEVAVELLGSTIVGQLLASAFSRGKMIPERMMPVFLYADEFQRFATRDFGTLLQEARKYRFSTTLAHQLRSQLDQSARDAVLGAGSTIAFQLAPPDASELARNLAYEYEQTSDVARTLMRLDVGEARYHRAGFSLVAEGKVTLDPPGPLTLPQERVQRRLDEIASAFSAIDRQFDDPSIDESSSPQTRPRGPMPQPGGAARKRPRQEEPKLGAGEPVRVQQPRRRVVRREEI